MKRNNPLTKSRVVTEGVLSFAPLVGAPFVCLIAGLFESMVLMAIAVIAIYGVLPLMLVRFIFDTLTHRRLETAAKIFWVLGLLFFPIASVPFYWFKFWWEPYQAQKWYLESTKYR